MLFPTLATLAAFAPLFSNAQVTATGTNGKTNPASPTFAAVGSTVNQNSDSRLVSLNGVNDFCLYGPPRSGEGAEIGNLEAEVVAYCTQPRNGARLIADGTIKSAHYVKTPLYVQISGTWDGTKVDIVAGDYGGELDPHGATGEGNPVGGNVTSNVSGKDVFYQEWMMYVSSDAFCMRICTAEDLPNGITAALQCEHELDVMGCNFVMAIPYALPETFDECEGDAAAPPGLYPLTNGSTSTFRQRYTGVYTAPSTTGTFTVGNLETPSAVFSIPATSKCTQYSSISNGVNTANFAVNSIVSTGVVIGTFAGTPSVLPSSSATSVASSMASMTGAASSRASSAASGASSMASSVRSAAASGATSAAAAATSGAAFKISPGGSFMDGAALPIVGVTFAGLIAGMAVLL